MTPHLLRSFALAAALWPLAASLQDPRGGTGDPWELVNQVQIIVNEDVLTLRQLDTRVRRELEARPISSPQEMRALRGDIATRAVQDLLMVQRGRDLGFDPEFVKRTVDSYMRDQAESAGGISELAERLALRGESAAVRKESVTDELYALTYDRAITGQAAGPGGRPTRDRYVRPGILALGYSQLEQQPAGVLAVGGQPEAWVLQQLVLATAPFPDPEQAREFVAELRERALLGEDFDELVATYSLVSEERGLSQPLTLADLRRLEPSVARFCGAGKVGDISEVLPILERGRPVYYRVLRIHERRPLVLPPFQDPSVQDRLRQVVLRNRDALLREEAVRELFRDSYIWTPETIRSPEGTGPPGDARGPDEPGAGSPGGADGARPDPPAGP